MKNKKLDNIATMASRLPAKVKKDEAFALVKSLIEYGAPEQDLAQLYSYFIPPVNGLNPKNDLQWVGLAVNMKDVREQLRNVYCDGVNLVGADGHRLHWIALSEAEKENYQIGFYDSAGNKLDLDYRYPDYLRVIPENLDPAVEYDFKDLPVIETRFGLAYQIGEFLYQKKFIDQATGKAACFTARTQSGGDRLCIEIAGRNSVIMPIRV